MLSEAVTAAGAEIGVLIDVDVGQGRCGVAPGAAAVELARRVEAAKGLELKGIQAYQGGAQHVDGFNERREVYARAIELMRETEAAFEAAGLPMEIRSGGGTGSWRWDAESGVLSELQAGSYLFMDSHYRSIGGENSDTYDDFKPSLFVLTTVVSAPGPGHVVMDAGHKALASDSGLAPCIELEGAVHARASDEHGVLELSPVSRRPEIGETLLFQPSHCDPTINLYDVYHGVRGGMEDGVLEAVIPVPRAAASGRSNPTEAEGCGSCRGRIYAHPRFSAFTTRAACMRPPYKKPRTLPHQWGETLISESSPHRISLRPKGLGFCDNPSLFGSELTLKGGIIARLEISRFWRSRLGQSLLVYSRLPHRKYTVFESPGEATRQ